MNHESNLLFGVLAVQLEFVSKERFVEACLVWSGDKAVPLAEIMVGRGWIGPDEHAEIDRFLVRRLQRHGGDAGVSLRAAADAELRAAVAGLPDDDLRASFLERTPQAPELALVATLDHVPDSQHRYSLSRVHATGGIGQVWLAYDASIGRQVAFKELRDGRVHARSDIARLLREARVTGQLEHPNIVPIYEVAVRPSGAPFYTMKFLQGRTFADAIKAHHERRVAGLATPGERRELLNSFVAVCQALAYAHHRGVIHRDLKPQNILLGQFGETVVLDWGLARVLDEPDAAAADGEPASQLHAMGGNVATIPGSRLGTPAYMAPEQARGDLAAHGTATDVFGLGATLYHLLADRPPFQGTNAEDTMRQAMEEPPAPPRRYVPDSPSALDAICLKALAKTPADRYPSAAALADDVKAWLADEPVSVLPEPLTVRAGRWVRRHSALAAGLSALFLTAALAAGVAAALVFREQRETAKQRDLADAATRQLLDSAVGVAEAIDKAPATPDLLQVRRLLVERQYAIVTKVVNERGENPAALASYGRVLATIATLRQLESNDALALESARAAAVAFEKLVRSFPDDDVYRREHAIAAAGLASRIAKEGRRREAERQLAALAGDVGGLAEADSFRAKAAAALVLGEWSVQLLNLGKYAEAAAIARRAAELHLASEKSDPRGSSRFLAVSNLGRTANARRLAGPPQASLPAAEDAVRHAEALLKAAPKDINVAYFCGRALALAGRCRAEAGDPGARTALARSVETLRAGLARAKLPRHRLALAISLSAFADHVVRVGGDMPAARAAIAEAERVTAEIPESDQRQVSGLEADAMLQAARWRLAVAEGAADAPQAKSRAADAFGRLVDADKETVLWAAERDRALAAP